MAGFIIGALVATAAFLVGFYFGLHVLALLAIGAVVGGAAGFIMGAAMMDPYGGFW